MARQLHVTKSLKAVPLKMEYSAGVDLKSYSITFPRLASAGSGQNRVNG